MHFKMTTLQINDSEIFLIKSLFNLIPQTKSNHTTSSILHHSIIKIFYSSPLCSIHDQSKIFFMCAIKIAASHGAPLVSPDNTSMHLIPRCLGRNTSPRTFSSTEKVFRRAALTLLRRNHAARVAGARRHSVPVCT